MREINATQYRVHVLVCTNLRTASDMPSCAPIGGEEIFLELKQRVMREGLVASHWITKTGCLGFCNAEGVTMVLHIAGKPSRWFAAINSVDEVWEEISAL